MRNYLLLFCIFCVLIISCKKNGNDDPQLPAPSWFTLKNIVTTATEYGTLRSRDSIDIQIDSMKNKITFQKFTLQVPDRPRLTETYTYNSDSQLVLFESPNTDIANGITRMEFVRDANGRVVKVLSNYNRGPVFSTEGTVTYDKNGDTTFITYIDTAFQDFPNFNFGKDYYRVGLVNNRVVYKKTYYFPMLTQGEIDTFERKYIYDAAGNLTAELPLDATNPGSGFTYQYGSGTPRELQKFMAQLSGDLFWFKRPVVMVNFTERLKSVRSARGNELTVDGVRYESYTNALTAMEDWGRLPGRL
jgi:hypothetical protein